MMYEEGWPVIQRDRNVQHKIHKCLNIDVIMICHSRENWHEVDVSIRRFDNRMNQKTSHNVGF